MYQHYLFIATLFKKLQLIQHKTFNNALTAGTVNKPYFCV